MSMNPQDGSAHSRPRARRFCRVSELERCDRPPARPRLHGDRRGDPARSVSAMRSSPASSSRLRVQSCWSATPTAALS